MNFGNTAKKNLTTCFYYPNQTRVFDTKRLFAMTVGISTNTLTLAFALFDASNMEEYVISSYLIVTVFGISMSFIDTIFKTTKIFSLANVGENLMKKSKQPLAIEYFLV